MSLLRDRIVLNKIDKEEVERHIKTRLKQNGITDYSFQIRDIAGLRYIRVNVPEKPLIEIYATIYDDGLVAFNRLFPG